MPSVATSVTVPTWANENPASATRIGYTIGRKLDTSSRPRCPVAANSATAASPPAAGSSAAPGAGAARGARAVRVGMARMLARLPAAMQAAWPPLPPLPCAPASPVIRRRSTTIWSTPTGDPLAITADHA